MHLCIYALALLVSPNVLSMGSVVAQDNASDEGFPELANAIEPNFAMSTRDYKRNAGGHSNSDTFLDIGVVHSQIGHVDRNSDEFFLRKEKATEMSKDNTSHETAYRMTLINESFNEALEMKNKMVADSDLAEHSSQYLSEDKYNTIKAELNTAAKKKMKEFKSGKNKYTRDPDIDTSYFNFVKTHYEKAPDIGLGLYYDTCMRLIAATPSIDTTKLSNHNFKSLLQSCVKLYPGHTNECKDTWHEAEHIYPLMSKLDKSDVEHFCVFMVDNVASEELDTPDCLRFMAEVQHQVAIHYKQDTTKIITWPRIIRAPEFKDSFVHVCEIADYSAKTKHDCSTHASSTLLYQPADGISTSAVLSDLCDTLGYSLPHPGEKFHVKMKSKRTNIRSHRSAVNNIFYMAQGHKHGFIGNNGLHHSSSSPSHNKDLSSDTLVATQRNPPKITKEEDNVSSILKTSTHSKDVLDKDNYPDYVNLSFMGDRHKTYVMEARYLNYSGFPTGSIVNLPVRWGGDGCFEKYILRYNQNNRNKIRGSVLLFKKGGCDNGKKIYNAQRLGAKAVIIAGSSRYSLFSHRHDIGRDERLVGRNVALKIPAFTIASNHVDFLNDLPGITRMYFDYITIGPQVFSGCHAKSTTDDRYTNIKGVADLTYDFTHVRACGGFGREGKKKLSGKAVIVWESVGCSVIDQLNHVARAGGTMIIVITKSTSRTLGYQYSTAARNTSIRIPLFFVDQRYGTNNKILDLASEIPTEPGCYNRYREKFGSCRCHHTCKSCGYATSVSGVNDCIVCQNEETHFIQRKYRNGTGKCVKTASGLKNAIKPTVCGEKATVVELGLGLGWNMLSTSINGGVGGGYNADIEKKSSHKPNKALVSGQVTGTLSHCTSFGIGDLGFSMEFSVSNGWYGSFEKIPGYTLSHIKEGGIFIFSLSAGAIYCTDDASGYNAKLCGGMSGIGFDLGNFLTPWGLLLPSMSTMEVYCYTHIFGGFGPDKYECDCHGNNCPPKFLPLLLPRPLPVPDGYKLPSHECAAGYVGPKKGRNCCAEKGGCDVGEGGCTKDSDCSVGEANRCDSLKCHENNDPWKYVEGGYEYNCCVHYHCFPAASFVRTPGGLVQMREVTVGTKVLTINTDGKTLSYEPITFFGHADPNSVGKLFIELSTIENSEESKIKKLRLSPTHFIPVCLKKEVACKWSSHVMKYAKDVEEGDSVWTVPFEDDHIDEFHDQSIVVLQKVSKKVYEFDDGLYNPYTPGGLIVVDGFVASAHSEWNLDQYTPVKFTKFLPMVYNTMLYPVHVAYYITGDRFANALGLNSPMLLTTQECFYYLMVAYLAVILWLSYYYYCLGHLK